MHVAPVVQVVRIARVAPRMAAVAAAYLDRKADYSQVYSVVSYQNSVAGDCQRMIVAALLPDMIAVVVAYCLRKAAVAVKIAQVVEKADRADRADWADQEIEIAPEVCYNRLNTGLVGM